jgi:hypothetical protein
MIKTNVVTMDEFRDLRETRRSQENYKRYLSTLGNSQLETEINFLLDEFSLDSYGKDFFFKVRLVQSEIVARADDDWKVRIEQLNKDSLQLLQP